MFAAINKNRTCLRLRHCANYLGPLVIVWQQDVRTNGAQENFVPPNLPIFRFGLPVLVVLYCKLHCKHWEATVEAGPFSKTNSKKLHFNTDPVGPQRSSLMPRPAYSQLKSFKKLLMDLIYWRRFGAGPLGGGIVLLTVRCFRIIVLVVYTFTIEDVANSSSSSPSRDFSPLHPSDRITKSLLYIASLAD